MRPAETLGMQVAPTSGMSLLTCTGVLAVVALGSGHTSLRAEHASPPSQVDEGMALEERPSSVTTTGGFNGHPKVPGSRFQPPGCGSVDDVILGCRRS